MKNTIVLTALAVLSLTACSQQPKNDELELANTITADLPSQVAEPFTADQLEQLRAIMKDEAAKAVGAVHLDLIASGKIFVPNTDPTYINGVPVAEIDHENSRYYHDKVRNAYAAALPSSAGELAQGQTLDVPRTRYKGYDYVMSFTPSHYVLELECMTSSFSISVLDSRTGERLEDLWFTVDEKQKLTQPNPTELVYQGRVSYKRFNQDDQIGTSIPDYGIATLRLTQLLGLVPEVIKRGETVEV